MNNDGQWQVAGSAPEVYERDLVPAIFAAWAPIVAELSCSRKGDRVLDLACGTGIVARHIAAQVGPIGAVVGVDLNPGMLKVAQSAWSQGAHTDVPVQWQEASADKLPFPNASFNVVCCQLGLQFFADRAAALREMHRVLVGGGNLALMVWAGIDESPGFAALAAALKQHIGETAAAIVRAPFVLSDAEELGALVRAGGFKSVVTERRVAQVRFPSIETFVLSYGAGSPLVGPLSQAEDAAREALIADTRTALGRYTSSAGLSFPIAAHLLTARA